MAPQSALAIEATGLVKSFGDTRAVDGVDLAVRSGAVYGVLGPERRRQDHDDPHARDAAAPRRRARRACSATTSSTTPTPCARQVSLTGQLASVDEDLTGRENLILIGAAARACRARPPRRAPTSCSGRSASTRRPAAWSRHYSGGMRRRLDIAASIVVTPRADVPRRADDRPRPALAQPGLGHRARAGREGTTILLCTQYLDEADQLADRIAVIDHGRVIAEGTPGAAEGVGRPGRAARAPARPRRRDRGRAPARPRRSARCTCESDPAALSAPVLATPTAPPGALAELSAAGHRRRRLLARPAEPRRGLPGPDRPPGRGADRRRDTRGGRGMSDAPRSAPPAPAAPAPTTRPCAPRSRRRRPPPAERPVGRRSRSAGAGC